MATLTCDPLRRLSGKIPPIDLYPLLVQHPRGKKFRCVSQFVMIIFEKNVFEGRRPLHVLIVVVGDDKDAPLFNAQAFCQSVVDFWIRHDDETLAHGMSLGTIDLVASDSREPNGAVTVRVPSGTHTVENPNWANARRAIQNWCARVQKDGAGIIHWVGHGYAEGMQEGGGVQILFTDDKLENRREGINWNTTIVGIDERTRGKPVFCFVDGCRVSQPSEGLYQSAFDGTVWPERKQAAVVYGVAPGSPGIWDDMRHFGDRAADLDFSGGPVATNAFVKCFEGLGADYVPGRGRHDVKMHRIEEGSRALVCRWMHAIGRPVANGDDKDMVFVDYAGRFAPMIHSLTPQSAVDVMSQGATACSLTSIATAVPAHGVMVPSSQPSTFEFIVPRGDFNADVRDGSGSYRKPLGETITIPHQQVTVAR
ncbi:hypothetical protein [Bradyrhizobium monzae]|uniref:hypothetical protein n=1 Tax=Bradyrhizobium sp. Oc8 TaxID=2876780 RepID=UPI001F27D0E6|nr:hypothetical protein [Bradyrhizobium sp. Oc8]